MSHGPSQPLNTINLRQKTATPIKHEVAVNDMPDKALYGTPGTTRTYDLRIRSPLLYPAELQARLFILKSSDRKSNASLSGNIPENILFVPPPNR